MLLLVLVRLFVSSILNIPLSQVFHSDSFGAGRFYKANKS